MYRIEPGEYDLCTVEYLEYPETDTPHYEAYCDSECATQVDFTPYDINDEKSYGDLVIWFSKSYAERMNLDVGMDTRQQLGYVYSDVPVSDFIEIIEEDRSIGGVLNSIIISRREDQITDVISRDNNNW